MKPITAVVSEWAQAHCNNTDVEVGENDSRATCQFTAGDSNNYKYRCFVEVYENRPGLMVFHYAPFSVPQVHRSAVAELLVRANYALNNGAIGMDMQDGEIRYKNGIDVRDGAISVAMINQMVDHGTAILDQYLPAVAAVVYAKLTPEQAYERAENPDEKPDTVMPVMFASIGNRRDISDETPDESRSELPDELSSAVQNVIRPWDTFSGCEAIRVWSDDLADILSGEGTQPAWALTGRAAVIVNDDKNYCRDILQRVASDNNLKFIAIEADDVLDMSPPSGLKQFAPALVYLQPGRWMRAKGDGDESDKAAGNIRNFQKKLFEWLSGFGHRSPVIYVTSTDKLENIASSLRNVGGFERFMSLPDQALEMLADHFIKQIGRDYCSESLLNATGKLGKLLQSETDNQRKLAVPYMQRLHCRENRLLEFVDLVHAFSRSLQEEGAAGIETDELRYQVAYHEAGHAVVAALDSDGKNIPEYASIVPSVAFAGIVIESYAFHHAHDDLNTYRNFRHQIRIGLAGRAAEEVKFGIENVSSASSGDLESASRSAFKAFLYWGFVPQMEKSDRTARNLGVVFGQPSDSEMSHVEALVREFMEQEYIVVKAMLEQNRSLLDAIATRLIKEPILDQDELEKIFSENSVTLN